jgi:hypothetical protein
LRTGNPIQPIHYNPPQGKNLADREKMTALFKLCGAVLLSGLGTVSAHAQTDVFSPTVPLSPILAPPLTADPVNAPITTLSTDLLAPQRPYIFDPSGAALISNALNPEIYSSSLNLSRVETDTQIRDSFQTGKISPYPGTARFALTFASGDDYGSLGGRSTSDGSFHGAFSGDVGNGQSGRGSVNEGSWGARSSFEPSLEESSWGTRRLGFDRRGNNRQFNSPGSTEGSQSETAVNGDSSGNSMGSANADSMARNKASSAFPIGTLTSKDRYTNPVTSRYAGSSTKLSGYGTIDGRDRGKSSDNKLSQSLTRGVVIAPAINPLVFFPQANYSQTPLGSSPFSSPGGELHFLNPDIYAATRRAPSSLDGVNGGPTGNRARQSFAERDAPAASAHYGLTTHTGAERSATGNGVKSKTKSSQLNTGLLDSVNP